VFDVCHADLLDLHRKLRSGMQHLLNLCDAGDRQRSCVAARL
jgi:hypothetical protein